MTDTRTIQRAAAETGLTADTLRYYERIGILPGIGRSQSGHRRFTDDDMGWIKLVQCLRATGMPLEDHRCRIEAELADLMVALDLVNMKIAGYTKLVAKGFDLPPPDHRPAPRRVRPRSEPQH